LIPEVAHRAFSDELLRVFLELCGDDTPLVRRSAFTAIPSFAKETPSAKQRDLLDALRRLARDDQESVRIVTIPTAMELAKDVFPNPVDAFNALFPEIRSCVDDSSWRVRVSVATAFESILNHTPVKNQNTAFELYNKLLSDPEIEVRSVALTKLPIVAAFKPDRTLLNLISPSLNKLVRDDSEQVRASLAESLTKSAPVFGAALTADALIHLILKSLRDQSTTVRLGVVANIQDISSLLKLDEMAPCLMPAIMELATDRQWRVRMAILEYSPLIAKSLQGEVFIAEFLPAILRWLCDPVFKVREAAAAVLSSIATEIGPEATQEYIVSELIELSRNSNYLYRIATLLAIVHMAAKFPALIQVAISLAQDPVPNVRYNVAKAMHALLGNPPGSARDDVKATLIALAKDADNDVRFFANQSIL